MKTKKWKRKKTKTISTKERNSSSRWPYLAIPAIAMLLGIAHLMLASKVDVSVTPCCGCEMCGRSTAAVVISASDGKQVNRQLCDKCWQSWPEVVKELTP